MATVVMALTGEPGAGKSTAVQWFASRGAVILDADALVRDLWKSPWLLEQARRRWGENAVSGGVVDKKAVSRIIFSDEGEYQWLCGLIYPAVYAELQRALPPQGIAVAEIPMLFEAGRPKWVDCVLFMSADHGIRAQRNAFRGLDDVELARREKFFMKKEERIRRSDWTICNDGSLSDLYDALGKIWENLQRLEKKAQKAQR
ncbi:MAG: dephospho-CoA kinase [Pyramidobacter sp.]|jgi:dephospho-CoA kinase